MAIYFPISVFKKWICSLVNILVRKIREDYISVRTEGILQGPETDLKSSLISDKDIREIEEGTPLIEKEIDETPLLAQTNESSSWKIAKCGLYLTPIWFAQEVTTRKSRLDVNFKRPLQKIMIEYHELWKHGVKNN